MTCFGVDMPKLGFGCMRFPKREDGSTDVEQVCQMVDEFLAAGGKYFDTARAYGESESVVRKALVERYPRESFYLATKNAAWIGASSAEEAKAYFDKSLEETGAGYFDFYLLHNLGDNRTAYFDKWDLWEWAKQLKAEGKVRHIGFSLHDNADVLDELLTKHPEMEFVQLQVNYADWENGSVQSRRCCEVARKHGKPIVVMEPVRGGTLANPPEPVAKILHEANPEASYPSWALRFALGVEGVMVVLSGMSSIEQMRENLAIWKAAEPLSAEELAVVKSAQEKLDEITAVPCTSCHYCMDDCPVGMDIANMMQALNRRAIYGQQMGQNWYNFATNTGKPKASECTQCGQCEEACPQHIAIIEELENCVDYFE